MHSTVIEKRAPELAVASEEKRRRFLNAYWLRPENAYWMLLRSDALSTVEMRSPSIDLSCGDGVFSFLHAAGRFAHDFDVFQSVDHLDHAAVDFTDIFDHVDDDYQPKITRPPSFTIDCGLDCKPNLLAKASRLGLYDRVVHHDNNQPLPFEDGMFRTVYCNAAYWIENVDGFLSEIRRITSAGGTIVLQVKTDAIQRFTQERHRNELGDRWLDIINRGRFNSWPSLCDRLTWEDRLTRAGLSVIATTPFVTGTHAYVWDIGVRPIAPMLAKTMNAIHPHLRAEIKRDWVDLFTNLIQPFCRPDFDLLGPTGEPVEIQYQLTPTV